MDYSITSENMITPVQAGSTLLADIESTVVTQDQVAIWWLGQSGYVIKNASTLFCVDLYLSEHLTHKYAATAKPHVRITHAPLRGDDLKNVRYMFSSHKHSDHLDPGSMPDIFRNNPDVRLILPKAIVTHAVSLGLDDSRLIPTTGDEPLEFDDLKVHVIPSAHPDLDYDDINGYPFIGFIFKIDGITLYHSGDTVLYDGLAQRLKDYDIDVAFLPVNGTDERRTHLKVPPNMDIEDALWLAGEIGNPLIIPHHYDMFTFNTVDVNEFIGAATAQQINYKVLQCGEKFIYER